MTESFDKLFSAFKNLSEEEKIDAIIEYLKYDINSLNSINRDIKNNEVFRNVEDIVKEESDTKLDLIYQLIHVVSEQVESFSKKIADDFFEDK